MEKSDSNIGLFFLQKKYCYLKKILYFCGEKLI